MIDWSNPERDYARILAERMERLRILRALPDEERAIAIKCATQHYREAPWAFIEDWGVTTDPRNAGTAVPVLMPFMLFPKQREWLEWAVERWRNKESGLSEKSRDFGLSWLAVSLGASLCLHHSGLVIGYGSRKEEYVDGANAPKSLFWKARQFLQYLPAEFNGGYRRRDATHMKIAFPATGSTMTGEAGDNIGRGDRAAIYLTDEEAFLERPMLVEAALSQTTNCRIGISTPNGTANPFAQKRFGGKISVFTCHWRDDPRKDEAWYAKQVAELDPVILAQEVDLNYSASVEGVLIPSAWVQACVDAHVKLRIEPSGRRRGAMDVADEGKDKCAFGGAVGFLVDRLEEWSGKGLDVILSADKSFLLADMWGIDDWLYDADGLGSGVRGAARVINERRERDQMPQQSVRAFRGSAEVFSPESSDEPGRLNKDFFMNRKAQEWWNLRRRFYRTYRAVTYGDPFEPENIISLSSQIALIGKLCMELSQPTYSISTTGKILVDKAPDGTMSPNLADDIMMLFGRGERPAMVVAEEALGAI